MKRRLNGAVRPAAAGVVAAAVLASAFVAERAGAKTKIDPREYDMKGGHAKILGRTASAWTAEWWQWAFSIPPGVHPLVDTTGQFVEVGQWGDVWFLGGVFGSGQADRTATIPTGKSLLVPIANVDGDNLGRAPDDLLTLAQLRESAAQYINEVDASSLKFTLDGTPIVGLERNRILSPPFEYHLPADNIYSIFGQTVPRGIFNPVVSDGYWIFLKPLPEGTHVLEGEATNKPPNAVTQHFKYTLTVVDHDRP